MSQNALRRLATDYCSFNSFVNIRTFLRPLQISERNLSGSGGVKDAGKKAFDVSLLEFLVCPLSKKPLRAPVYESQALHGAACDSVQAFIAHNDAWSFMSAFRYEETTNRLINDELGIAYPILDGIPNMIPQDARLIKDTEGAEKPTQS